MKHWIARLVCKVFGHKKVGFGGHEWCERCNGNYIPPPICAYGKHQEEGYGGYYWCKTCNVYLGALKNGYQTEDMKKGIVVLK